MQLNDMVIQFLFHVVSALWKESIMFTAAALVYLVFCGGFSVARKNVDTADDADAVDSEYANE